MMWAMLAILSSMVRLLLPFAGCAIMEESQILCALQTLLVVVRGMMLKTKLKIGLNNLGGHFVKECLWDGDVYYNSGHIAKRAAGDNKVEVWTSDRIARVRECLKASGLFMLEDKYKGKYNSSKGYSILDHAADFDFIFIDPFSGLLKSNREKFVKICSIINQYPKIFIMVFVLYTSRSEEENKYYEIKKSFEKCAFSLRCPAILDSGIEGESTYDMEILIISKQLETNQNADKLREDLVKFAGVATKALPLHGKEIKFWPDEENK